MIERYYFVYGYAEKSETEKQVRMEMWRIISIRSFFPNHIGASKYAVEVLTDSARNSGFCGNVMITSFSKL
jgi:hypothetical protein